MDLLTLNDVRGGGVKTSHDLLMTCDLPADSGVIFDMLLLLLLLLLLLCDCQACL
jgi:hypothetical protein